MGRIKAYKEMLNTTAQVKHGIYNFELFLRKVIAEEEQTLYSPEAGSDPENRMHRNMTSAADVYQRCVEFAENNNGNLSGEVMSMLLEVLSESVKAEDHNEVDEVLKFAQSKGFHAIKGASSTGEEVVIIFQP